MKAAQVRNALGMVALAALYATALPQEPAGLPAARTTNSARATESPRVSVLKPPAVAGLPNLTLLKEKLRAYHDCACDCGCYSKDLERVGGAALEYLQRSLRRHPAKPGEKLAIVLDIDDTALSNYENLLRHDFALSHPEFIQWEKEAKAPAIKPTLDLFHNAQEHQVAVFFLTNRPEAERADTVRDLESAGYRNWTGLIMKQPGQARFASDYKSAERKKLRESGWALVLNLGDQESDLVGEPAGRSFKLPNPFYYTR